MTNEQVQNAFRMCDDAFHKYIREATETHRMLSVLSGSISFHQSAAVLEQRVRENDARKIYLAAREQLFEVLARSLGTQA